MTSSENRSAQVELTNNGDLSLYCIGTGSAFAKSLGQNNLLIVKGNDHLLIDCGTKCSQSLHDVGLPINDIKYFLITHSHADHIGGLEEVHLYGRYVSQQKPFMVITETYQNILWEQSLKGGAEMSESPPLVFEDFWHPIRPKLNPDFARETWEVNIGSINIKLPRTKHIPDDAPSWRESFWSVGVIIDNKILYTSDTRFDPDLLLDYDQRFDFEVIFHDCQLFSGGVHASLNELKTLPEYLRRKIILMHYGDDWRNFQNEALEAGFHSWAKQGHTYTFPELAPAIEGSRHGLSEN
ncbi:MAG: MBL fold metallo-hydrolase [Pseudomonadales bacterium]|nr:MBL fold metallo-hydrolase [Pseudomonadales bacterium]